MWLSVPLIEAHIVPMRTQVINYMCELSDKDLRFAGQKNTTELMYESFKETNSSQAAMYSQDENNLIAFKVDKDGLKLAYKYFLCSTLTIRLCGIAQMNVSKILPQVKIHFVFLS
jgi:ubiquitin carboxyl-terminal hydrolase 34